VENPSSHHDFRSSFPFCVLCMAILSTLLILSMDKSVKPSDGQSPESITPDHQADQPTTPSSSSSTPKEHELPLSPHVSPNQDLTVNEHDWDRGSEEDKYWEDGADA